MAIDTYFKNIADAIRTKTGSSGLIIPANMPDEILNIQTGMNYINPLHFDLLNNTYIATGLYAYSQNVSPLDVYEIESNSRYILFLGATIGHRFRVSIFPNDPYIYNGLDYSSGALIQNNTMAINTGNWSDNPQSYAIVCFNNNTESHYLTIQKDNNGLTGIKTYLLKIEV